MLQTRLRGNNLEAINSGESGVMVAAPSKNEAQQTKKGSNQP